MIEKNQQIRILEAALFAAGKPLTVNALQQLFTEEEEPSTTEIKDLLQEIQTLYADRGLHLIEVASGFTFRISADLGPWVSKLWEEKAPRYSRAFLETLAIIAYRQPVTRGEIEFIRGVTVNVQVIKTLQEREWIQIVGHKDVPGKPALFATTKQFLDYFGLKTAAELPQLVMMQSLESLDEEAKTLAIAAEEGAQEVVEASQEEAVPEFSFEEEAVS